ncbi:MAG: hypothetical protein ACP5UH_02795 [Candidatus Micrarchaeia archaeon]
MANKGNSRHLKALSAPRYFAAERKGSVYIAKQSPGRFRLDMSVPLIIALDRADTGARNHAELRGIVKSGSVKVNYKTVADPKYPVGLNDIIELGKSGKSYMVSISPVAKLVLKELESTPKSRVQKVVGKFKAKGNKLMVRLYDGTITSYGESVNVNDSVEIDDKGKISRVIKMNIGSKCFFYAGVHVGETGTIKELTQGAANRGASAKIEGSNGSTFSTLLRNIMVIG